MQPYQGVAQICAVKMEIPLPNWKIELTSSNPSRFTWKPMMAPLGARGSPQVKVTWVEFIMLWLKKLTGPGTEKKIL